MLLEKTVVHWGLFTGIFLFTGLIMTPIMAYKLEHQGGVNNNILHLLFNIMAFGGLLAGLLIVINYYFAGHEKHNIKVKIDSVDYRHKKRRSCKIPTAEVKIGGINKSFSFPCGIEMDNFKFLEIRTKKGLLGFDVITYINPTTE